MEHAKYSFATPLIIVFVCLVGHHKTILILYTFQFSIQAVFSQMNKEL